jgi:hypothetical protein
MALTCSVACASHGITATHAEVMSVTTRMGGNSEGVISLYKDNSATVPFMSMSFTFPTDMDSGTDGKGVNAIEAAEVALTTTDGANLSNPDMNNCFVGATQV